MVCVAETLPWDPTELLIFLGRCIPTELHYNWLVCVLQEVSLFTKV